MIDPNEIYQRLITAGNEWAEAEAAASLLEEGKKTVLNEIAQKYLKGEAKSMAQAESMALADEVYSSYITDMVEARKLANKAKVNYYARQTWCELKRTQESTKRAEMRFASEG